MTVHLTGAPAELERRLEPVTEQLRDWSRIVPAMGGLDVDAATSEARHEFIDHKRTRVHLELHQQGPGDPTIVLAHGIGAHARLYTPLAARLHDAGFNVLVVDRPGHGLSEGRRGDCPVERSLDVLEDAIRFARARSAGPVVLGGSSLGGVLAWYALTREPDVDAAFCHFIAHPAIYPEPGWPATVKVGAIRTVARAAPTAPVPVSQVADFGAVADDPRVLAYWSERRDPLYCFNSTARSIASIFEFRPPIAWSRVGIPTLVVIGAEDRMTPPAYVERVLEHSAPPRTTYRKLPGRGHLLPIEALDELAAEISDWTRSAIAAPSGVGV